MLAPYKNLPLALLLSFCFNVVSSRKLLPREAPSNLSTSSRNCGKCGIEAPGGVRLIYWQPDVVSNQSSITAGASEIYTQVLDGFTFTSPSVYAVYSSLRATVTCDSSILETIGPSFTAKTIAYSSRFLAYGTLEIPGPRCDEYVIAGGFHTIDFEDLYYNPITTTTSQKPGCSPYANPRLSLPADLTSVDSAWASCEPFFVGAFDPPSALKKASGGLVPTSATQPSMTESEFDGMPTVPATAQAIAALATHGPTSVANAQAAPIVQSLSEIGSSDRPPVTSSRFASPAGDAAVPQVATAPTAPSVNIISGSEAKPDPTSINSENNELVTSPEANTAVVKAQSDLEPVSVQSGNPKSGGVSIITPTPLIMADQQVQRASDGASFVASQTIPLGSSATVSGIVISVGNNNLVVGGITHSVSPPSSPRTLTPLIVGGNTAEVVSDSGLFIASQTFQSGSQATINGDVLSVGPQNVSPNGVTLELPSNTPTPMLINGKSAQKLPNGDYVIVGQTIPRGSQATISGARVSGGFDELIVGGTTDALPFTQIADLASVGSHTPFLIAGQTAQRLSGGALEIAGQIIKPGVQATISRHVVSTGASDINLDGSTLPHLPEFTGTAWPESEGSLLYTTSNAAVTLTSGATYVSEGNLATYAASTENVIQVPTVVSRGSNTTSGESLPYLRLTTTSIGNQGPSEAASSNLPGQEAISSSLSGPPGKATGSGPATDSGLRTSCGAIFHLMVASLATVALMCVY